MENDIKIYREKELKSYVIGNIILILLGSKYVDYIIFAIGSENIGSTLEFLFSSSLVSSLVYIYTYIIDALIPGDVKNRIIWWNKGLPGNRVFSDIKNNNKDNRFTTEEVLEKYKSVYNEIREKSETERKNIENSAWYNAYQKNENSAKVFVSNRDWLLCRDMCAMTLWIIIGSVFVFITLRKMPPIWLISVLVFELLGTWGAARVKSKRFVYNVIAKDVRKKTEN